MGNILIILNLYKSMKKQQNRLGTSILRTIANKNAMNFATRRLLHDYYEIQNCKTPTVGVVACPFDDNLF